MKREKSDLIILMDVLRLTRPYRWAFIGATALAVLLAPLSAAAPLLINLMVDASESSLRRRLELSEVLDPLSVGGS